MPLASVKRPRDITPVATHSFDMVKRSRPSNATLMGNFIRQAMSSKLSTSTSTSNPLILQSQSKVKSRPQLRVELPPTPSFDFIGLSPITSFLSSSSHTYFKFPPCADPKRLENADQCVNREEFPGYPCDEAPYFMLYDSVSPENEFHTSKLMQKITRDGSPSFLHVPTSSPVRNALDLGCGYGHWVAHAAQVWGAHGANITGISIPFSIDEEQTTLPGVDRENVKLLCHNFLTEQLPFPSNSFDYVRLNDVVTAIPGDCWDFVLSEVHRVLSPGGRLELIHDQLCFSSIGPGTPVSCSFASTKETRSHTNVLDVSQGKATTRGMPPPGSKKSPYGDWEDEMRNCNEIERLYLDLLAQRYGVHPLPRAILLDAVRRRFGDENLLKVSNAHVCLPSREFMARSDAESPKSKKRDFGISITIDWDSEKHSTTIGKPAAAPQVPAEYLSLTSLPPVLSKKAASLMGVVQLSPAGAPYQPPGVVVVRTSSEGTRYPMTYFPTSPTELDMHSNKHLDSVISAKLALEAHIDKLREEGKPSMSHEALDETLWQYAMFRRKRFNWPELDPFEWESEFDSDGEPEEPMPTCTLPGTQTTDGLTPIRLFEIFEVVKSS